MKIVIRVTHEYWVEAKDWEITALADQDGGVMDELEERAGVMDDDEHNSHTGVYHEDGTTICEWD